MSTGSIHVAIKNVSDALIPTATLSTDEYNNLIITADDGSKRIVIGDEYDMHSGEDTEPELWGQTWTTYSWVVDTEDFDSEWEETGTDGSPDVAVTLAAILDFFAREPVAA